MSSTGRPSITGRCIVDSEWDGADCPCPYCNGYEYDGSEEDGLFISTPAGRLNYSRILKDLYVPIIVKHLNQSSTLYALLKEKGGPKKAP